MNVIFNKVKGKQSVLIGFLLLILTSCGQAKLKPTEYIRWCDDPENGLIKSYQQGDIELKCQYLSPAYGAIKQFSPETLSETEVNEIIGETEDMVQFKLTFENKTSNNFLRGNYTTAEEFDLRSMYLGYGIRTDLELVMDSDTVTCAINHHERTYGNTPYEVLLMSFPKPNEVTSNQMEVIFTDRVFGLGRVKFFFSEEDINAIPELVF